MTDALNIEWWPIENVTPYQRNPRTMPDAAVGKVSASIHRFGFKAPIIVDADGVIIAGHTRLAAAKRLNMTHVPVLCAVDLTRLDAAAYRLADNRVGEENTWDLELLNAELEDLAAAGYDVSLTGFDPDELSGLGDDPDEPTGNAKTIQCPECGHVFVP